MAYVVRMPKLGVEMETGLVVTWHVEAGDSVDEEDLIAEIESEKSTAEVTARESGVLRGIYMAEGDEGPPGAAMGIVAGPDEDVSALAAEIDEQESDADEGGATADEGGATADEEPAAAAQENADAAAPSGTAGDGAADTETADAAAAGGADVAPRTERGRIRATPKAKKRAEERGVALRTVPGTGPQGSIVAADVEEAAAASGGERTVREQRELSSMRSTIADRLGRSYREAAHVTVDREVEVEAAFAAAERAEAAAGVDVAITDVFLAAVSATLSDHPEFNATFDGDAEVHTLYEEHNLGIAVDLDGGLVTPVVPDVRGRSPADISGVRRQLVDRVLSGDYAAEDLSGGTFTVSNLGVFGSDSFTPIINPPEVAILGVNRVRERAVNTDTGIDFRRHVTFSLSFDHRVVDGADAAKFLTTLEAHLQDAGALVDA